MNIFYLSHDFEENARFHVKKHNIKMILEQLQILSTTHRVLDGTMIVGKKNGRKYTSYTLNNELDSVLYKATHVNHPSTIWARQSKENYLWLANMTLALCKEYTHRSGKIHKCEQIGLVDIVLNNIPKNIPNKPFTQPTPAMDEKYIINGDSIASYRKYYNEAKRHLFDWSNHEIPEWIEL